MIRIPLTLCLLGFLNLGRPAGAANAPAPKVSKLEKTSQHLFVLADADKNGSLSLAEQALAESRAEKAIRQLVHDNTIGGHLPLANVAEPQLADPAAMTVGEFTRHFEALAANKDAALRALRIAKNQPVMVLPSVGQQRPVVYSTDYRGRDRYDDDKYRDNRHQNGTNGYMQPNQYQYASQPVFNAPMYAGSSSHSSESAAKHGPAHSHTASLGNSHGHGGHHGK